VADYPKYLSIPFWSDFNMEVCETIFGVQKALSIPFWSDFNLGILGSLLNSNPLSIPFWSDFNLICIKGEVSDIFTLSIPFWSDFNSRQVGMGRVFQGIFQSHFGLISTHPFRLFAAIP